MKETLNNFTIIIIFYLYSFSMDGSIFLILSSINKERFYDTVFS